MSAGDLLDGRIAVVTGGGRGIGRAHSVELARHGAVVVVNDLDADAASDTVGQIRASGGSARVDATSVTDFEAVGRLVAGVVEEHGRLDVVVNNAGVLRDAMITNMTEADFDQVVAVHLKGTFALLKHACVYWRERSKAGERVTGRVINTTSGAGLFGNIGQANYGSAKAAIAGLTIIAAMENQRYGVTVNAISPLARTRMTEMLPNMQATAGQPGWDRYDPANSSPVVAWLASEASGWLTGAVLRVDGNLVRRMQPWSIDDATAYRSANGERLDATELDRGLRVAFDILPGGLVSRVARS